MLTWKEIVAEIISELTRLRQLPQPYSDDDSLFPQWICDESGRQIFISYSIRRHINNFAKLTYRSESICNYPRFQQRVSMADYQRLVWKAFRHTLSTIVAASGQPLDADSVSENVKLSISSDIGRILNDDSSVIDEMDPSKNRNIVSFWFRLNLA